MEDIYYQCFGTLIQKKNSHKTIEIFYTVQKGYISSSAVAVQRVHIEYIIFALDYKVN